MSRHFAFGENWTNFSSLIDSARIEAAQQGLLKLIHAEHWRGVLPGHWLRFWTAVAGGRAIGRSAHLRHRHRSAVRCHDSFSIELGARF